MTIFSVRHPVVEAFLWRKWATTSTEMGQNLRFALLFLLSLNRLIIEKYGGKTNRADFVRRRNFTLLKTSSNFCYDYERDWGWHPSEGFGWEYPSFWYVVNLLVCLFLFFFAIR